MTPCQLSLIWERSLAPSTHRFFLDPEARNSLTKLDASSAFLGVSIVVGGDYVFPIPMLQALQSTGKKFTILQIGAHINCFTSHMDEGMRLSSTMWRASEIAHIQCSVQVGARNRFRACAGLWGRGELGC